MIKRIGVQLFTIRDFMQDEKSIDESFAKMSKMGYTTVQTAGYEGQTMADLAKKHGITIVGTHVGERMFIDNPEKTLELHRLLNTTNIGSGAMPPEAHADYDGLMKYIESMNKAAEFYAKEGFKLTYHNHSFEFRKIKDGKRIIDYIVDGFDKKKISFVLDTCWVANAGADVCQWLEKLAGRIDIIHLKDLNVKKINTWDSQNVPAEIGNGNLNFDGIITTAEKTGVKEYIVEQDREWIDGDPFKSLEFSANYLKRYM